MKGNMRKGKIAEKIVEGMFKEAGFKVIRYGYEYTVPELADKSNLINGKAGKYIRHQPDFIVVNGRNEAFFVEVKHRSKKIIPEKEIFPYPNCYVLLLTKRAILAQSTNYLFSRKENFKLITDMPPFKNIPKTIIMKYVKKLRRLLGDETLTGQFIEKYVEKLTRKKLQEPIDDFEVIRERRKKRGKGNIKAQKKRWRVRQIAKRRKRR